MEKKEPAAPVKPNLLFVDDEEAWLKILEKIFEKHYTVKTATSGEDSLEILKSGFQPAVIVTDQRMPGMTGSEFLEQSIQYVPNAVRIILTGYTSPKDIIPCINQGRAYMYLSKPSDELSLIQAVRIGFDYYNASTKSKELNSQINEKNERIKQQQADNNNLFNQNIQAVSGIMAYGEQYYFTEHAKSVALIARTIAEHLHYDPETIATIIFCSFLSNIFMLGMPYKFIFNEPDELEEDYRKLYFDYFNDRVALVGKVSSFAKHAKIISQIWEHQDGTGYPNQLEGGYISKEASAISIALTYHNKVYRVPKESIAKLRHLGKVAQTPEETQKRHNEVIKLLYKRANWYELDIFNVFQDLVKTRDCPALVPEASILIKKSNEADPINESNAAGVPILSEEEQAAAAKDKKPKPTERDVPIAELEPGMIVAQNVVTKKGMLVVRQGTTLDAGLVQTITQMEVSGLLVGGTISIQIPQDQ